MEVSACTTSCHLMSMKISCNEYENILLINIHGRLSSISVALPNSGSVRPFAITEVVGERLST